VLDEGLDFIIQVNLARRCQKWAEHFTRFTFDFLATTPLALDYLNKAFLRNTPCLVEQNQGLKSTSTFACNMADSLEFIIGRFS